jgi:hypothetical protein
MNTEEKKFIQRQVNIFILIAILSLLVLIGFTFII